MPLPESAAALTAVARLVTEATSLSDVMARLGAVIRSVIPFERMHLLRLDRSESVVLYSASHDATFGEMGHHLLEGPEAGSERQPVSASAPEDPADPRAVMMCPLRHGGRVVGALWFASGEDDAFTDAHRDIMDGLADLLALAVTLDATRTTETVRRERLRSLDRLLQTVAGSLDVRSVFSEVSTVVSPALPHDHLVLTAWADDGRSLRVVATAGAAPLDARLWAPLPVVAADDRLRGPAPFLVQDADMEVDATSAYGRLVVGAAAQSALRVAVPLPDGLFGSLFFLAHDLGRFDDEHVEFARRVAGGLALALSLEQLTGAGRREAAAQEAAIRLRAQVAALGHELDALAGHRAVVGSSARWTAVLDAATRVATSNTTVLLTGESGTGKELVARMIHEASPRRAGPFVAVSCAGVPDALLEAELFGRADGALGPIAARPGRIDQATGGTLFLDDIGDLSALVQAKILRVLEERAFERPGSTRLVATDMRVLAATSRDLADAVARGVFRGDLYGRLRAGEIALPPLRERREDIPQLASRFLAEMGRTVGRPSPGMSPDVCERLLQYAWPGNVRELRNAIERAVILADGGLIRGEHLPFGAAVTTGAPPRAAAAQPDDERGRVAKALEDAGHNKTRAAKLLGLTRSQLSARIEKYGLSVTRR